MARLPTPGGDNGNWGTILNDFLSQTHKSDGTLKDDSVTAASIQDGAITETQLASTVTAKLNDPAVATITETYAAGSGIDPEGSANSSSALAARITGTTTGYVVIPPGEYDLDGWVTPTHSAGDLTIVGDGRVKLNSNGTNFIKVTGGSLTIRGIEFDGFSKLVDFNDNATDMIESVLIDRVSFANSPSSGMISYFATTNGVLVNRLEIRDSVIHDCRQGIHFRGRAVRGIAVRNEIYNTAHYSIRFGKDWADSDWQGEYLITENHIYDQYNATTGSGHEANMIAVFGDNAVISGNILENLTNAQAEDCEGIYLKSRQFTVSNNTLRDVGMDEGAIIVKGHPGEVGSYAGSSLGGVVTGNVIRFREQRDWSIGINVLRSDVLVTGNQIIGAGINGIRLSWRGAYENVTIENNTIAWMNSSGIVSGGHPLAAILLFGYGKNIVCRNNTINGAYTYGIRLENNISSDVRYVLPGITPIGEAISIEANTIIGSNIAGSRGISVGIAATAPTLDGLRIVRNHVSKFADSDVYLSAQASCDNWVYDDNELAEGTVNISSWPTTIYLGGIEWSASDTLSSAATTKTISHTIPSTVAAKLTRQDVTLTHRGMSSATKIWLQTINATSVQIAVDQAPGASLELGVKIFFNRVVTS